MVRLQTALLLVAALPATPTPTRVSPQSPLSNSISNLALPHDGGRGPYRNRTTSSHSIPRDPPPSCTVDQVILLKRHGERYPDPHEAGHIKHALSKIPGHVHYDVPSACNGQETVLGAHPGLADAFAHGQEYRSRYGFLLDDYYDKQHGSDSHKSRIPVFASSFHRVVDTARSFGRGFFGSEYMARAALNLVPEGEEQGADSLAGVCGRRKELDPEAEEICRSWPALEVMGVFEDAASRLNERYEGWELEGSDVFWLMAMTAYDLDVHDDSPWVDVFTENEWIAHDYMWGLKLYYCGGYGNKAQRAVGAIYANATLALLNQGPVAGRVVLNVAHEDNITPVLAALNLLTPPNHLPVDHVPAKSDYFPWLPTEIVPMGARLTIERLTCADPHSSFSSSGPYVRLILNEAVLPFRGCVSGPGHSCPLGEYTAILDSELMDFADVCGIPEGAKRDLRFFWDYSPSNKWNGGVSKELDECLHALNASKALDSWDE